MSEMSLSENTLWQVHAGNRDGSAVLTGQRACREAGRKGSTTGPRHSTMRCSNDMKRPRTARSVGNDCYERKTQA